MKIAGVSIALQERWRQYNFSCSSNFPTSFSRLLTSLKPSKSITTDWRLLSCLILARSSMLRLKLLEFFQAWKPRCTTLLNRGSHLITHTPVESYYLKNMVYISQNYINLFFSFSQNLHYFKFVIPLFFSECFKSIVLFHYRFGTIFTIFLVHISWN